jgi:hypothetical protein
MRFTLVVIVLLVATTLPFSAADAAESKSGAVRQWEYRVLTEGQVLALGKNDLATGLNKLGDEGWELVTVGGHYIFKRPKDLAQNRAAEIKRQLAEAEADVEAWKDRVGWAERMVRKGYMTEKHLDTERAQLKRAQSVLDAAREALKKLPSTPKGPEPKKPESER